MDTEHHIVLPSNGTGAIFETNTTDDYTTLLSKPLDFTRDDDAESYRVALQEVQFVRTLPTVKNTDFTVTKPTGAIITITIRKQVFGSITEFINEITTRATAARVNQSARLVYSSRTFLTTVKVNPRFAIKIPTEWANIFGFTKNEFDAGTFTSDQISDLYRGVYNLCIYSDIVQPIAVGNSTKPLLGIVNVSKNEQTGPEVVAKVFTNPMHLRLADSRIQTIRIYIRDELDNKVHFRVAPVIVRLSIRKIQS